MKKPIKQGIAIVLLLCLMVGSIYYGRLAKEPEHYERFTTVLDETRNTVLGLTTVSTAAATIISLLPDDKGTPIANQLAEMSSYFLIILCALYLEKFLMTVLGWGLFQFVIPVLCGVLIFGVLFENGKFQQAMVKLLIFCLAINMVIPLSVTIIDFVQDTYYTSINEVIDNALKITADKEKSEEEVQKNLFSFFASTFETVKDAGADALNVARYVLNYFIDAIAVLIITSCVIPILTMMAFVALMKYCFRMEINIPSLAKKVTAKRGFPQGESREPAQE